jgi:hypothetical protein
LILYGGTSNPLRAVLLGSPVLVVVVAAAVVYASDR